MASGVRIHHMSLRNCTYCLWVPGHLKENGRYRNEKKRHFTIDDDGNSCVSWGVWEALSQEMERGLISREFIILNEVSDPPKLVVSASKKNHQFMPTYEQKICDAIRQIAPSVSSYSIKPSNKYRSDTARITNNA